MTHRTRYVVLAAVAALAVCFAIQQSASAQKAAQFNGPASSRPPAPTALPRWEYATLRFDIVKGDWVWTTQDEVKRGDKRQLFRELGGYGRRGDHDISYVDISSQAGLYGWELVNVVDREKGSEIWFKRPVR